MSNDQLFLNLMIFLKKKKKKYVIYQINFNDQ